MRRRTLSPADTSTGSFSVSYFSCSTLRYKTELSYNRFRVSIHYYKRYFHKLYPIIPFDSNLVP